VPPAAQNCPGGYTCSNNACQTTCSSNTSCLSDYFCYANACRSDVVSISTGTDHTCAALKDGRVYCWGESTFGGLGNGSNVDTIVLSPVRAGTFTDATVVSMGSYSSYALTTSGTIRAWGRGQSYELGNGVNMDQSNPVIVQTASGTNLSGVSQVVGGNSVGCANTSGGLYCWGANGGHSLGVDAVTTATAQAIPYASPVMGFSSPPAFFGGGSFHVAVNGSTVCPWDSSNGYQDVTASTSCNVACYSANSNCFTVGGTVVSLAAGGSFGCVRYGPNIQCWGENDQGAIGGPTNTASVAPPGNFIGLSPTPIDMEAYGTGVCALLNDGVPTLKCWGYPFSANATTASPPVTIATSFPSGVKAKALGIGDSSTACLITDEGSPWCFGTNTYGNVGNGTQGNNVTNPTEVLVNW
jgi:alpha-tubulin suppressor-like RCC1 family protein